MNDLNYYKVKVKFREIAGKFSKDPKLEAEGKKRKESLQSSRKDRPS